MRTQYFFTETDLFRTMYNEAFNSVHSTPQRQARLSLAAGDRAAIYSLV